MAIPYRDVTALVVTCGSGQVAGSVCTGGEALVQLTAEGRQSAPCLLLFRPVLDHTTKPRHTERHDHRLIFKFCGRNPKIMTRWPPVITVTRRTTTAIPAKQDSRRLNGKLSGAARCRPSRPPRQGTGRG